MQEKLLENHCISRNRCGIDLPLYNRRKLVTGKSLFHIISGKDARWWRQLKNMAESFRPIMTCDPVQKWMQP
jgi:hypothetical protein